ncbi:MAG: hypothetical protein GY953_17370 [bacterium]|nr:hypothetical protein [bacterium]
MIVFSVAAVAVLVMPAISQTATTTFALDSTGGREMRNAKAEVVTYKGRKGIRVVGTATPPQRRGAAGGARPAGAAGGRRSGPPTGDDTRPFVIIEGVEFQDGAIEFEVAGSRREEAGAQARGFVGLAFRVADPKTYECFYLRPTNGRAEDQARRNHSAQYMSHPEYTWFKLRNETPSKYEAYVDLVPGEWTQVKIVVKGTDARLYVHGSEQPTLIVKDLKRGNVSGGVALWLEASTVAYFRNVKIAQ